MSALVAGHSYISIHTLLTCASYTCSSVVGERESLTGVVTPPSRPKPSTYHNQHRFRLLAETTPGNETLRVNGGN